LALIKAGWWHTTWWPSQWWHEDWWLEYGTATPPVAAVGGGVRRKRKRPFESALTMMQKQHLELLLTCLRFDLENEQDEAIV